MKNTDLPRTGAKVLADRRTLLKKTAVIGAGVVVGAGVITRQAASATDLTQVDENGAQARALAYRHDATDVDLAAYPTADPSTKICANCQLFKPVEDSRWGGCPLFGDKTVNMQGWCSVWARRLE